MKKNVKTVFCCQSCGYQAPKWLGRCPDCGKWQTFVEEVQAAGAAHGTPGQNLFPLILLNLRKNTGF
jgi:DNA repair protein RadA/Sms